MHSRRAQGIALVLVLWLTTLLAVMAATFALNARREVNLLRGARINSQGAALCEGAIHYAMGRLSVSNPLLRWRADGSVYELFYGGGRVRVQLLDEAAKVDLNTAQEPLLRGLFAAVGLGQDEAAHMTDVIMDWRDADELRRFHGAEAEDYRLAVRNFGPRNKPFQAVEELQTVLGMTPALYQSLQPWVTVYSKQPGIDPRAASADLLRRLPDMNSAAVESYLQAREQAAVIDPLVPQRPTQLPPLQAPPGIPFVGGSRRTVGVYVEARLGDYIGIGEVLGSGQASAPNLGDNVGAEAPPTTTVSAVVGRGTGRQALTIYRWRERFVEGVALFKQAVAASVVLDMPQP